MIQCRQISTNNVIARAACRPWQSPGECYELCKLQSLPPKMWGKQGIGGVRLLRLPGYGVGGQDHAPQMGRACPGGGWRQRRDLFWRLHIGMSVLPEPGDLRKTHRHTYGFCRSATSYGKTDCPGGGEHRFGYPHSVFAHHPACADPETACSRGVQLRWL